MDKPDRMKLNEEMKGKNVSICFDPFFGGKYILMDDNGNMYGGYDTLEETQKEHPNLPIGQDIDFAE